LVQSVVRYAINFAHFKSRVAPNAYFCCNYSTWQLPDCLTGKVSLSNHSFTNFCSTYRSVFEVGKIISPYEVLLIREGCLAVENLSRSEVDASVAALSR
jgi:hypothetical protein